MYIKRIRDGDPKWYIFLNIIHNNRRVEATQAFISNDWSKQNMVYTYKGMLFSITQRKGRKFWQCYHIDKPWGHYASWNKPVTKDRCDSIKIHVTHRDRKGVMTGYSNDFLDYDFIFKFTETVSHWSCQRFQFARCKCCVDGWCWW